METVKDSVFIVIAYGTTEINIDLEAKVIKLMVKKLGLMVRTNLYLIT